jgi:hypothetical protein
VVEKSTINSSLFFSNPIVLPNLGERICANAVTDSNMESNKKQEETSMTSEILRTCKYCGKTASNQRELFEFIYNKSCPYHRAPYCKSCFGKIYNARRIHTHGMWFVLPYNPRKGICTTCGKTIKENDDRQQSMHHDNGFNPENVLDFTVEECMSCHAKERFKVVV